MVSQTRLESNSYYYQNAGMAKCGSGGVIVFKFSCCCFFFVAFIVIDKDRCNGPKVLSTGYENKNYFLLTIDGAVALL